MVMRKLIAIITVFTAFAACGLYASVSPPKNVSLTYDGTAMQIAWDASSDTFAAASYNIYRATYPQVDDTHFDLTAATGNAVYVDPSVDTKTPYYYKVQAVSLSSEKSALTSAKNTNPRPPQGITAAQFAAGVALTWAAAADAGAGYKIYRSTDGIYFSYIKNVTSTTYTDLTPTVFDFYYKLTTNSNNPSAEGAYSGAAVAPAMLQNVLISYDYAAANTGNVRVTWRSSTSIYPAAYNVYRSTNAQINTATDLTGTAVNAIYLDAGVNSFAAYYYSVQPVVGLGSGLLSQVRAMDPMPTKNSSVTALNSKALLMWDAAPDASVTEYNVYRSSNAWADFISYTVTTNEALDQNLMANGIRYEYRVSSLLLGSAISEGATTAPQPITPFASPYQPVSFTAAVSGGNVDLSWSLNGAQGTYALSGYNLYRSLTPGVFSTPVTQTAASVNSYTDISPASGLLYYYQLLSVDVKGNNSFPVNTSVYVPNPAITPSAPLNLTITSASTSTIRLKWDMNNNPGQIDKFRIYRNAGFLFDAPVADTFADSNGLSLNIGSSYTYFVTAYSGITESATSNTTDAVKVQPAAPINLTVSPSGIGTLNLSWSNGLDETATIFNIYRTPAFGPSAVTVSVLSYIDSLLATGTTYSYEINAHNGIEGLTCTAVSAVSVTMPVSPLDITDVGGTPYNGYVYLSWTAAAEYGLTSYTVYRAQDISKLSNYVNMGTTSSTSMYVNVTSNVLTYFAVTSNNAIGGSSLNTSTSYCWLTPSSGIAPDKPMNLTATCIGNGKINLSWSPINAPVPYYNIYRSVFPSTAADQLQNTVNALVTNYPDTNVSPLSNTTTYYYRVAGTFDTAATPVASSFSDTVSAFSFMSPAPPDSVSLNNIFDGVLLSWKPPVEPYTYTGTALSYNIYRSTFASGFGSPIKNTGGTLYEDYGIDPAAGGAYFYKIKSVDTAGNEDISSKVYNISISGTLSAPGLFARPGNRRVTLIWTKATGGTYNIYRSIDPSDFFTPLVYDYPFTNKQYVDEDPTLQNRTPYFYAISAVTDSGEGRKSVTVSAEPYEAPHLIDSGVTATVQNFKDIQLVWTAAVPAPAGQGYDIKAYHVYRSNDGGATYNSLSLTAQTTYTDYSTQWNNQYIYRVTVVDTNDNEDTAYEDVTERLPLPQNKLRIFNNLVDLSKGQRMKWHYYIVKSSKIKVTVYTLSGAFVKTLLETEIRDPSITVTSPFDSGIYFGDYFWDGTNAMHKKVASGVYIIIMELDKSKVVDKIAVVK
jgi:fibronectin type 3 domain-containing protein